MPLPVLPETVSSGTPRAWLSPSSSAALMPLNRLLGPSATSHLLIATSSARPSCRTWSAILKSCASRPRVPSSSSTTTSAKSRERQRHHCGESGRAGGAGARELLGVVVCVGFLPLPRRFDQPHRAPLAVG